MTNSAVQTSIKKYNNKRGVAKHGIHMFRHTFAKMWIVSDGDILKLQKILGHSSLEIVRKYVNLYAEDLSKNYDSINPLEKVVYKKRTKLKIK